MASHEEQPVTIYAKAAALSLVSAVVQVAIPQDLVEALARMLVTGNSGGVADLVKLGVAGMTEVMRSKLVNQGKL